MNRCFVVGIAIVQFSCATRATTIETSPGDRVNRFFGPRRHYDHIVVDRTGKVKETYVYYLDTNGLPVLDGERVLYNGDDDLGRFLLYKDGRIIERGHITLSP